MLQQALLALLYQWERVRDPESWLFGTVKRHCLMYWRTHRRRIYSAVDSTILEWLSEPIAPSQERRGSALRPGEPDRSAAHPLPLGAPAAFPAGLRAARGGAHARLPGVEHRQDHHPVPRGPVARAAGLRAGGRSLPGARPADGRPPSRRAVLTIAVADVRAFSFLALRPICCRRIESLDSPLVQLWGWPGSGRTAVLEALLARQGRHGPGAAPGRSWPSEAALREALEAARGGVRWLVASGRPAGTGSPRPSAGCARGSGWSSPPTGGGSRPLSRAASCRPRSCCSTTGEIADAGASDPAATSRRRPRVALRRRRTAGTGRSGWRSKPTGGLGLDEGGAGGDPGDPRRARSSSATRCWTPSRSEERDLLLDAPDARPGGGARGRGGVGAAGRARPVGRGAGAGPPAAAPRRGARPRAPAAPAARRAAASRRRRSRERARSPRPSTSWVCWAARSPASGTRRGSAISTGGSAAPSRCSPFSPPRPASRRGARS